MWINAVLPAFIQTLRSLQRLSTALNILEKYGCNLTNPNRPKYWRTVKHNNPVFRATVDAIQVKIHHTYHNAYDGNHVVVTIMAAMGN